MDSQEIILKVILIGQSRTGKTNIHRRYLCNEFINEHISTIGVDFTSKKIQIDGFIIKFQIWDTSGEERFRSITKSYYRGANAVIMVFDLNNKESFKHLYELIQETKENTDNNIYLVGNKVDLPREVNKEDIEAMIVQNGFLYFETSALSNVNVNELFENVARDFISKA